MTEPLVPITVKRTDWGLQMVTDSLGNWYQAFVTEFEWNGRSLFVEVDQILLDLAKDAPTFREQEEIAAIEQIAFNEGRSPAGLNIVEGDGDGRGRPFPRM